MYYNDLCGERVSALGFGSEHLPSGDGRIDQDRVDQMVDRALEGGVNYFDTAWGYCDGLAEAALGRALRRHDRSSYFVADKFPGYDLENFGDTERIFEEQLERTGLERFDFYLLHNVCEYNIDRYTEEEKYHTLGYLKEQEEAGRIGHLGFSSHAQLRTLQRIGFDFKDYMEFAQIQVNWMDWTFQEASEKLLMMRKFGFPVIATEPVRGGTLAAVDDQSMAELDGIFPGWTAVEWSFRFQQSLKGLQLTISGMSDMAQLEQDLEIYETRRELSRSERNALADVGEQIAAKGAVPCTRCDACVSQCLNYIDVPGMIALYNEHISTGGKGHIAPMAIAAMRKNQRPGACNGCERCEHVCPQEIKISEIMRTLKELVKEG